MNHQNICHISLDISSWNWTSFLAYSSKYHYFPNIWLPWPDLSTPYRVFKHISEKKNETNIEAQRGIMWRTHTWLVRASLIYRHINLICLHNTSPLGAFLISLLGKLLFYFCTTVYVQSSYIRGTHAIGNDTFPTGNTGLNLAAVLWLIHTGNPSSQAQFWQGYSGKQLQR